MFLQDNEAEKNIFHHLHQSSNTTKSKTEGLRLQNVKVFRTIMPGLPNKKCGQATLCHNMVGKCVLKLLTESSPRGINPDDKSNVTREYQYKGAHIYSDRSPKVLFFHKRFHVFLFFFILHLN